MKHSKLRFALSLVAMFAFASLFTSCSKEEAIQFTDAETEEIFQLLENDLNEMETTAHLEMLMETRSGNEKTPLDSHTTVDGEVLSWVKKGSEIGKRLLAKGEGVDEDQNQVKTLVAQRIKKNGRVYGLQRIYGGGYKLTYRIAPNSTLDNPLGQELNDFMTFEKNQTQESGIAERSAEVISENSNVDLLPGGSFQARIYIDGELR